MKILTKQLSLRRQRGLAIVELAIVLPLLLLLLMATAELGRVFYQQDTLTKAVRDGGRYLAGRARFGTGAGLNGVAFLSARNRVLCGQDDCSGINPLLSGMTLPDVAATAPDSDNVLVSAQYNYQPMLGPYLRPFGLGPHLPLNFTLTASTVMRIL